MYSCLIKEKQTQWKHSGWHMYATLCWMFATLKQAQRNPSHNEDTIPWYMLLGQLNIEDFKDSSMGRSIWTKKGVVSSNEIHLGER